MHEHGGLAAAGRRGDADPGQAGGERVEACLDSVVLIVAEYDGGEDGLS